MDNVSQISSHFWLGFLGFILAAYSYNKHHKRILKNLLIKQMNKNYKITKLI